MKYYVHVTEQSQGSCECEYENEFNSLGEAWEYIHLHDGYQEFYLQDNGDFTCTPVLIPHGSDIEPEYWTDYSCSHVYTR